MHDAAVQMIDTSIVRVHQHGGRIAGNAEQHTRAKFVRARGIRNGLMLALLALCPIRSRNFAALEIGNTFKQICGRWWVTLPGCTTKMGHPEEHPIAVWLNPYIDIYLKEARPALLDPSKPSTNALWISSTRQPITQGKVGSLISQITKETIGVAVSPHLFRTARATTAAVSTSDMPHLASALLGHKRPSVTAEHYNRASLRGRAPPLVKGCASPALHRPARAGPEGVKPDLRLPRSTCLLRCAS
jgi:integrase